MYLVQCKWCTLSFTRKGAVSIRLAEVRREKGWTQTELAEASGINRVTIARYETGKQSPTLRLLEKLAEALGVSISDLSEKKAG